MSLEFSLFLIWFGGLVTGFLIGYMVNTPAPVPVRVKTSDLFPPKDPK